MLLQHPPGPKMTKDLPEQNWWTLIWQQVMETS
jgi:hypothetical protein